MNLGIILLASVLSFSTGPFAFSQATAEGKREPDLTQKEGANEKKKSSKQSRMHPDENVIRVQTALKEKGFDPGPIDGIMGPRTRKAVAAFQRELNFYASGQVDRQTESALGIALERAAATETDIEREKPMPTPVTPPTEIPPALPHIQPEPFELSPFRPNVGLGTAYVAEDVRLFQMALKNRGYDPGEINGVVTSETQEALRQFQAANNLPVTGIIDDRTQAALGVSVRGIRNPDVPGPRGEIERTKPEPDTEPQGQPMKLEHKSGSDHMKTKEGKIDGDHQERLSKSAEVLQAMMKAGDRKIPMELLQRAEAIAVIPNMKKGAFGIGGSYGKGVVARRMPSGLWSAPAFVSIGGGSFGLQLGVSSTDLVLVFTDKKALDSIESGASLKLGADAAVVAGPIGREAEAGVTHDFKSAVYAYSRSKGLFAGVALDGAVIDIDHHADREVYGDKVDTKTIMRNETMATNPDVRSFVETLNRLVPKKVSKR